MKGRREAVEEFLKSERFTSCCNAMSVVYTLVSYCYLIMEDVSDEMQKHGTFFGPWKHWINHAMHSMKMFKISFEKCVNFDDTDNTFIKEYDKLQMMIDLYASGSEEMREFINLCYEKKINDEKKITEEVRNELD